MSFLSAGFFVFCPVVVLVYHIIPPNAKAGWLLMASWYFYLCAGIQYAFFLLFATVSSYAAGRLLERSRKRWIVALSAGACFGLLFVFKYLKFTLDLITAAGNLLGLQMGSPALQLVLPAGLSFYLFQAVGYVVDVYRGDQPAQRNFLLHALFLSFFPQLLSGPIARAPQLMPQLEQLPTVTWDGLRCGAFRFLWGAFKKLVIADRLAILVNTVFAAPASFGRLQIAMAVIAFSIQIYCDFSAYSDMALGAARCMGFTLMENFQAPYFSRSVREFWRRWHISLSSWFRDYLYIPLGGSHRGRLRSNFNLILVFAVSGLWHGAALNFLVWGLLNGCYLVIGNLTTPIRRRIYKGLRLRENGRFSTVLQLAVTFVLSLAAWIFFQSPSLTAAGQMFLGMLQGPLWIYCSTGLNRQDLLVAAAAVLLVFAVDCAGQKRRRSCGELWLSAAAPLRWCAALGLLLAAAVFGCYGPGYDAQSFLYFQF